MDVVLASARPDLRFALEVLLREQPGLAVVGTATGSQGLLALIETTFPDLVILDWDLPGRPPPDVLSTACSSDSRPYLIVLGQDGAAQKAALDNGADAFVVRGDPPEYLLKAVEKARPPPPGSTTAEVQVSAQEPIPTEAKGE